MKTSKRLDSVRCTVTRPDGTAYAVKNLGWLLRNWKAVESFRVKPYRGTMRVCETQLVAYLRDGRIYETPFASASVLRDWLHRPVFRGCPVTWETLTGHPVIPA